MVGSACLTILLSIFFVICPGPDIFEGSGGAVVFNTWVPMLKSLNSSVFFREECYFHVSCTGLDTALICLKCATVQMCYMWIQ